MNTKTVSDFARCARPNGTLGETSVSIIWVGTVWFQQTGTLKGYSKVFLMVPEIQFGQSVKCSIDKLLTIGIKTIPLIIPKTPFPVLKTRIMAFKLPETPTPYTRMCFPSDLARTGDFTQGQVGIPPATVGDRKAAGNDATDGLPLPGDSPPLGNDEAPEWGENQSAAGKAESLPAGRVF